MLLFCYFSCTTSILTSQSWYLTEVNNLNTSSITWDMINNCLKPSSCSEPTVLSISRSSSPSCGHLESSSVKVIRHKQLIESQSQFWVCIVQLMFDLFQVCLQSVGCSIYTDASNTFVDIHSRHRDGRKQQHLSICLFGLNIFKQINRSEGPRFGCRTHPEFRTSPTSCQGFSRKN